jgi:hypothetical protein
MFFQIVVRQARDVLLAATRKAAPTGRRLRSRHPPELSQFETGRARGSLSMAVQASRRKGLTVPGNRRNMVLVLRITHNLLTDHLIYDTLLVEDIMPSTCFSITIPEDLRKRLKAAAQSARCSEAQIARLALEMFLNKIQMQPLLFSDGEVFTRTKPEEKE